MQIIMNNANTK